MKSKTAPNLISNNAKKNTKETIQIPRKLIISQTLETQTTDRRGKKGRTREHHRNRQIRAGKHFNNLYLKANRPRENEEN